MTDLRSRGKRLLAALETKDATLADESNPMREVALSAALAIDRLDALEQVAIDVPPYIETRAGKVTHPVLVEVRQQATLVARLIAALRMPDAKTGRRPQARPPRGVHVSSLERARARARADVG